MKITSSLPKVRVVALVGVTHSLPELFGGYGEELVNARRVHIVGLATDYIHKHYHRPIQRTDVAAFVKMNPAYFSTVFSKVMGVTFRKYVEKLRLTKAQELLEDHTRRINEVADAVGYKCPNRFRDVFKANTGLSPFAWRNQEPASKRITNPTR